jgi:hypothetical protein
MLKAANDKPVHAPGEASEIIRHACLLIVGATAVTRHARAHPEKNPWIIKLLARMPAKKAAVALANKTARIAWALLAKGGTYRQPKLPAAACEACNVGA